MNYTNERVAYHTPRPRVQQRTTQGRWPPTLCAHAAQLRQVLD